MHDQQALTAEPLGWMTPAKPPGTMEALLPNAPMTPASLTDRVALVRVVMVLAATSDATVG
jgi:hypothetical protein